MAVAPCDTSGATNGRCCLTNAGPDLARLERTRERAASRSVFAAGGLRDLSDIDRLAAAGVAGVLVATALHDGRLSREALATVAGAGPWPVCTLAFAQSPAPSPAPSPAKPETKPEAKPEEAQQPPDAFGEDTTLTAKPT